MSELFAVTAVEDEEGDTGGLVELADETEEEGDVERGKFLNELLCMEPSAELPWLALSLALSFPPSAELFEIHPSKLFCFTSSSGRSSDNTLKCSMFVRRY